MGLYKTAFSSQDQNVLPFSHWGYHFLAIFSKAREFVQKRVFCPRSARFVIFALSAPLFSKVHEFLQNSLFSPRSARFVIVALGAPRFSDFQQSAGVSIKKSVFSPTSARFVIFSPGAPLFSIFSKVHLSLTTQFFNPEFSVFCHV